MRWLLRWLGFDRPPIRLDENGHREMREQCARELREQIGAEGPKHLPQLLEHANDNYLEQDRRMERAERRAASIQAAVATLLGLTTATGGLLIHTGAAHRLGIAAVFGFIVISLILTAVHALGVQAAQHDWVRPNDTRYLIQRAAIDDDFDVEVLITLLAAARHNAMIGDWKYEQLEQTARAFRVALIGLVLVPIVLLIATPPDVG